MFRISGGNLRKLNSVMGGGWTCCRAFNPFRLLDSDVFMGFLTPEDDVDPMALTPLVDNDILDLRPLENDGALVDVVALGDDSMCCRILELRRRVDTVTSIDDPTCCWALELCRVVSTLSAVTGAIVGNL